MAKVLPNAKLEAIPASHPLMSTVARVQDVACTPAVNMRYGAVKAAKLEGIALNGDLRVIYSPIDIEAGWAQSEYPMALAYRTDTATSLGMNILMYSATH